MAMRTDCRHYESRTYASGEVVRKCRIDFAPEAPWNCPENCVGFEKRMYDAGWQVGTLEKGYEPAPDPEPQGEDIAALLDAAEEIVNSAAPDILDEFEKKQKGKGKFLRRKKRK
jgi:hypothetical protein